MTYQTAYEFTKQAKEADKDNLVEREQIESALVRIIRQISKDMVGKKDAYVMIKMRDILDESDKKRGMVVKKEITGSLL